MDEKARLHVMTWIFRPSGGWLYHWRARRHQKHWHAFKTEIENWLSGWIKPGSETELILIGPSGGYTLPTEWLKGYEKILAFDPDPLAPFFFNRHHRLKNTTFVKQDMFWSEGTLNCQSLEQILKTHPRAVVLFANVLGQLLLERKCDERSWQKFLNDLRATLRERKWASYHDVYSYHRSGLIIDHLMLGSWSKNLTKNQFRWVLRPEQVHEIEGVTGL